ncbi:hypothetical protein JYU34_014891 [Plutella xylostella]|uniref:Lipase n=1 Tax=Plutella xylostella TaxID=51655 RepID=A0ABQ7Q5S8_PLUXY|nr:hypothetical protein JYU34_014891 [Plutella xylostella]
MMGSRSHIVVAVLSLFLIYSTSIPFQYLDLPGNYSLLNGTNRLRLGFNEDAILNFTGLTSKYGYPSEEHTVTTEDGYILTLFRMLKREHCGKPLRSPVILMHGFVDTADTFIIAGPRIGLAYLLADACYDVWCPNHRGSRYSRRHVTLDPDTDAKFWNYTYDEHGMFDLPAVTDYVLDNTRSKKLSYVGHSQGTAAFFVLASTRPEYNKKFNVAVCLGPIAWFYNTYSPLIRLAGKFTRQIQLLMHYTGVNELFGPTQPLVHVVEFLCQYIPKGFCGTTVFVLAGQNPDNIGQKTLAAIAGHYPRSSSANSLVHFGQMLTVDKFRRFDYGTDNMKVYGTPEPPEFDLSRVKVPVALIAGKRDWFVSLKDVDRLNQSLPNVIDYYIPPEQDWSHGDFVWGAGAPRRVAPKILQYLKKYG